MHTPWGARPLCDLQEGSAVPVRSHISSPFPFSSGTGADESSELVASTFVYGRHSRAQSWALQFLGNETGQSPGEGLCQWPSQEDCSGNCLLAAEMGPARY